VTETDLAEIEARLGFPVPSSFRATALAYPFQPDSFADEFMLPNRPSDVIDLNEAGARVVDIKRPFFIGSDGGEEWYFVDASEPDSAVYVYELETGRHRVLVASWAAYLGSIRETHAEIAADQASDGSAAKHRRLSKHWWEFWK
jgi:hypothetical protein